jgi:hypothetical protein
MKNIGEIELIILKKMQFTHRKFLGIAFLFGLCFSNLVAASDCSDASETLVQLAAEDQKLRQIYVSKQQPSITSESEFSKMLENWKRTDSHNRSVLKDILNECGWPDDSKASHNAWLIAQHADEDPAFQKKVLGYMEKAVADGKASAKDYAYLEDRVAITDGKIQPFGTQFEMPDQCTLLLKPIDSREQVNNRRKKIGLESLEQYEQRARDLAIPLNCGSH